MADRLMPAVAAAVALLVSTASTAQTLTDPTRPPFELLSAATGGAAPLTPLQSILLSSARKGAIINGQYVALGGAYGKAKLVKITATEVTLKSDEGLEVLQLYPPMEKTSATFGVKSKPEKVVKRP
jgi:hypothetical protein